MGCGSSRQEIPVISKVDIYTYQAYPLPRILPNQNSYHEEEQSVSTLFLFNFNITCNLRVKTYSQFKSKMEIKTLPSIKISNKYRTKVILLF